MKSFKYSIIFAFALTIALVASCKKKETEETPEPLPEALTPYTLICPSYFPQLIIPADNQLTVEGVELGRKLYYDTILSNNGRACASCHTQQYAFSNPVPNSMSHVNLAWNNKFLWNGLVEGKLEDIMAFEVNVFFNTDVTKLNNSSTYPTLFKKIFNSSSITTQQVAYALAQFIRTQSSTNSKFDKYLRYETSLTSPEMNGFILYNTEKGDCFHCHSLGLFNDNAYHNNGNDSVFAGVNRGHFEVTGNANDMGKFKTPTLRNVELTAPYMHDGRFATLEDVIEHYNSGVKQSSTLDPIFSKPNHLFGLQLTTQEKSELLAFLKTLTDSTFINNPALAHP